MKSILLIILTLFIAADSFAAFTPHAVNTKDFPVPAVHQANLFKELSVKKLQSYIGRKLTFREKIQLLFAKKILAADDPVDEALVKKARSHAWLGFGFSLAGIFLIPLFSIPAIIFSQKALRFEKEHPGSLGDARSYAKAGNVIGWIGIALLVVVIALVLLLLAAWGN